jgi:hypothetical protein
MSFSLRFHLGPCVLALATVGYAQAQTSGGTLSLDQALALAKAQNGTIASVVFDNAAARARGL